MDKVEIEKIINDLWSTEAEEWVNYIVVEYDGSIWGFETSPDPVDNCYNANGEWTSESIWVRFSTQLNGNCPNWKEFIFERPLNLKN